MHLAIGGPTRDTVPASFALDLAQLYAKTREHGPWSSVTVGFIVATYVHAGREQFLQSCVKQDMTHVLWLDTDMSFPPETAIRLALHERPFVACNYLMRGGKFFTARRDGRQVETTADSTGLEAVDSVGLGVALMRMDVALALPRPWFRHGLNEQGQDIGEDVMFCRAAREAGFPIWVDHDLSKEIGHVGLYTHRISAHSQVAV